MFSKTDTLQFILGAVLGSVIACSPTKFGQAKDAGDICDSSETICRVDPLSVSVSQNFQIGNGKVDILFVGDNSASMSDIQKALASKFAGFIQNLDSRKINYRIAVTTTDLNTVSQQKLIPFAAGKYFITNEDADRIALFNRAIVRDETSLCEGLIVTSFNYYGTSFQSSTYYKQNYPSTCPSSDTRGIYTANLVVSENSSSFMRDDANLHVILVSNDNVRQGKAMEDNDKASTFTAMMERVHPNKYWDFNSIIVKDETCRQAQTLRTTTGQEVMNGPNKPALAGAIGSEYMNLSNSAARDIDNNPRPRGLVLNICESNYANHFNSMAIQISQESRMVTLKCTPQEKPTVSAVGSNANIPFTWSGDKIIFSLGNEGTPVSVSYSCYTGPT